MPAEVEIPGEKTPSYHLPEIWVGAWPIGLCNLEELGASQRPGASKRGPASLHRGRTHPYGTANPCQHDLPDRRASNLRSLVYPGSCPGIALHAGQCQSLRVVT